MSDEPTAPDEGLWKTAQADAAPTAESASPAPPADHAIGGDGADVGAAAEADLWAGRTHWKHFAGRLALWLLANVLLAVLLGWIASGPGWPSGRAAFWVVLAVFVVSGLFVVGGVVVQILTTRYRVTSQRLFIERGLLTQTVDQTELIRVDDVRLKKTVLDRMFGLGSVAVLSTDATDRETLIEGIAEPEKVAEAIRQHMRSMRKKSLFVENL
jgi:membrane protein YdbS with pleckstrin-like domain